MATIKIIDSGLEKYSLKSDTNVLGRMYDNNAEAVAIIIPEAEAESVYYANVMSCEGLIIDRIKIENNLLPISSNLTQYCEIYIGFSFIRPNGTEKQSEQLKFGFLYAIKPKDFTPEQPDTEKALAKLIASGFVKLIQDGDTVKFYNWQDIVVGTIYHEGINGFEIVDELPTENIDTHTIYLVKETIGEADDYYNEYIYVNGEWELLGSTRIDLSDYYTKEQVDKIIKTLTGVFNEKVDIINGNIDKKFDKTGGTVTGDIVVGGNLTVQGKTTTVDSETLRVTDKLIEVGKGNTAPLTSPAGLITPKYDGTNNGGIVYDHTGTAYVGDISLDSNGNVDVNNSDLQPIATRNAAITDGNIVEWNNTNKTLVDSGKAVDNLSTATNLENGTGLDSLVQKYSGKVDATHFGNTCNGESAAIFGEANFNSGNRTLISGKMNRSSAPNSLIIGLGNGRGIDADPTIDILSGEQLFVFGALNSVSNGNGNAVLGAENILSDVRYSTIIGRGNIIDNTSLYEGKCVVGRFNNQKPDTMFEVGVGDYNNRVNGFEVYKDGRAKVQTAPVDTDDVVRKLELDNLNARYVSTSILGG